MSDIVFSKLRFYGKMRDECVYGQSIYANIAKTSLNKIERNKRRMTWQRLVL